MGYTPPYLEVRKVSGGWSALAPSATATDDLYIYANTVNTYPVFVLDGNGSITYKVPAGSGIIFNEAGSNMITIVHNADDVQLQGSGTGLTNHNIFLNPNGTGKVKFGTFTASGDVAVNGSVDILDSAGNTRKLATIA